MKNARAVMWLVATIASSIAGPAPARVPGTPDAGLAQRIDAVAARALSSRSTAGLAIGVSRSGRPDILRGYGFANLEDQALVTADTAFRIGSITKEFTAACILLLAERGKLSLNDPLAKYLPAFPRGSEVTLRQLLTHTSGIHNYTSLPDFFAEISHRELSTAAMVEVIARERPLFDFEPGTKFTYSNSGFFLLGAVIEKVSGQSYPAFLQANVLSPLELRHTRPDNYAEIVPGRASGYERAKDAPDGFTNADYISITVAASAGAMRSTLGDLLRWQDALLDGKLLKPQSLATMLSPGRLSGGRLASTTAPAGEDGTARLEYGLGIAVGTQHGRKMIGHGGSINGFNASLESYPDQQTTIVLLTNTGGGSHDLVPVLADAVFALPVSVATSHADRSQIVPSVSGPPQVPK